MRLRPATTTGSGRTRCRGRWRPSRSGSRRSWCCAGRPGSLPGGLAALWVASWLWLPGYYLLPTLLLLLAPDGRLPGDRWKPVAWLGVVAVVVATAQVAVSPYPRGPHAQVTIAGQPAGLANPVAWSGEPGLVRWSVVLLPAAIVFSLTG